MHTRSALVFWPAGVAPVPLAPNKKQQKQGEAATAANAVSNKNFLVGWNVRDFTVVVAAVVAAPSSQQVLAAIAEMHATVQRLCFSEVELPSAPALTIVGILHQQQQAAQGSPTDRDLQDLRASTNAYVELEEGAVVGAAAAAATTPTLRSLYTSGIKFDAALHLLTYDAGLFDKRRVPLPFSPLVRLEVADVEKILAGEKASRVLRGAKSVLEGPFLPPHALNLMPPLHPRHLAPRSVGAGAAAATTTATTPNTSFAAPSVPLSPSLRATAATSSSSSAAAIAAAAAAANASSPSKAATTTSDDDSAAVEADMSAIDPTVPPRLTFPTANSLTDFSCCKSCLGGAAYLQHRLQTGDPDLYPSDAGSLRKQLLRGFEECLVHAARLLMPLALLLLVPITQLATFSYTAAIMEYKLRELVNALALIQGGGTSTCGLHPVLPHTLCGMKGERRTCLLAFAARQIVGDIFLGVGLFWLLMLSSPLLLPSAASSSSSSGNETAVVVNCTTTTTADLASSLSSSSPAAASCESSVYDFMRDFTWYGLYRMHVGYFAWFHGYPAGFKMNADLNEVLCMLCFKAMELFAFVVAALSRWVDIYRFAYTILLFSSLGGASFALSWAADCCNVATLHLRYLFHVVSFFYHGLTTVTGSLLLLMRGKKRNPRRGRVDDASFEFDEVVLGTMACTACAFLVPTVALYYLYLACARTVIWVLQESIRGIAVLCCNAPIYPCYLWLARRKQWVLTGGVVMTNERSAGADADSFTAELAFVPLPFVAIFRELGLLVRLLFSGTFSVARIVRFIWTADAGSKPIVDVANIVMRHLKKDPARPALVVQAARGSKVKL